MATAIPVGKVVMASAPPAPGGIELGRHPISIGVCSHCNQSSTTRIKTYPSWETWVAAGVLVLVFWPICWIPLVTDSVSNCKCTYRNAHVLYYFHLTETLLHTVQENRSRMLSM